MNLLLSSPPNELRKQFFALNTREDIANLLNITDYHLRYHLYVPNKKPAYQKFLISKKNGGTREISVPVSALKIIQQKLNQVLQSVYAPKPSVHGFTPQRSIVSNAKGHINKKYVLNLDLDNFFTSINFGRVRGMFMHAPYNLNPEVATVLAQICCHNNCLPQGAPTSPVIANMICAKLDSNLQKLAQKCKCTYTRYADDITFSTSLSKFPSSLILSDNQTGQIQISQDLEEIIIQNGFLVNKKKLRLLNRNARQEVTGLIVNKKLNIKRDFIRQIRAMLHNWSTKGLETAQQDFWDKYDLKRRNPKAKKPLFMHVVKGKIEYLGMIRGKNDPIYLQFLNQLKQQAPNLVKSNISVNTTSNKPIIIDVWTEGKTDSKHLQAALSFFSRSKKYTDLVLNFNNETGDTQLVKFCEKACKIKQPRPLFAIFDRDKNEIIKQVTTSESEYKIWGNNVFSIVIPIPNHRKSDPSVCIEMYYQDLEIKKCDSNNRCLYLSNEFNPRTGRLKTNPKISIVEVQKCNGPLRIIDDGVFDEAENNLALTKDDFAENILQGKTGFDNFAFDEFSKIFDFIIKIIESK